MAWRHLTEHVVVGAAALLCGYDLLARVCGGNEATISAVVSDAGRKWPVVAVAVGALMAHWFWPAK